MRDVEGAVPYGTEKMGEWDLSAYVRDVEGAVPYGAEEMRNGINAGGR